jgi:hypothetical protein
MFRNMGYTVVEMAGKDNRADVLIAKDVGGNLTLCGVCEIRCRASNGGGSPLTVQYLRDNGGYMITTRKVEHGEAISRMLMVPFFVAVYLINEDVVLVWKVTDDSGRRLFEIPERRSSSRKTVNGGLAYRVNSYLPMDTKNLTIIGSRSGI